MIDGIVPSQAATNNPSHAVESKTQADASKQENSSLVDTLQKFVGDVDLYESATQEAKEKIENAAGQHNTGGGVYTSGAPQPTRNVYVEESVKVLEALIIQADPLLQELASIVKEFEDKS